MTSSLRTTRPKPRSPRRRYHHGDLRPALLEAALGILAEQGAASLTLRAVARGAGVSQTAPYRHFKDRSALIGAVAIEAFARLGGAIGRAVGKGPPGLPALERGLAAYVRFAHLHPAEYRVMFGAELAGRDDRPEVQGAAEGVFRILGDGIAQLQGRGLLGRGDPVLMAIAAWATVHGLVMLTLDGRTAATGRSNREVAEATIRVLLTGMGTAPAVSR